MYGDGKSHSLIIPTKLPNEAEPEAKEAVEERGLAKGKTLERNRFRTQRRQILSNTLERIREGKEGSRKGVSIAIIPILLHRRHDPRQEPDAAIPHVRIRAGGRPRGRFLPRQVSIRAKSS